jgi:tetratricopeptide (TPR) repeat protein
MKRLLLTLLLCLCFHPARAAVFEDANRLYEQGKFAEAIPLYQNLLKSGHHSPGVLFNLGNAHFKNGELGRAIHCYRRAQRIAPRDPDIQANLRFARERVSGALSIRPTVAERALRRVSLDELAGTSAVLFWMFAGLLSLARWQPSRAAALKPFAVSAGILLALSLLALAVSWNGARHPVAIVAKPQAVVHLGPLAESQAAFTAPDGSELRILSRRENWLQVADRSGRSGWMNSEAVLKFGR